MHIRHAPYGRHYVVPSVVSLAYVYTSLAKPALAGMYALPAPTEPISAGKAISFIMLQTNYNYITENWRWRCCLKLKCY